MCLPGTQPDAGAAGGRVMPISGRALAGSRVSFPEIWQRRRHKGGRRRTRSTAPCEMVDCRFISPGVGRHDNCLRPAGGAGCHSASPRAPWFARADDPLRALDDRMGLLRRQPAAVSGDGTRWTEPRHRSCPRHQRPRWLTRTDNLPLVGAFVERRCDGVHPDAHPPLSLRGQETRSAFGHFHAGPPPPLAGGGWGRGRRQCGRGPLPPTPSRKGRGRTGP